MRITIDFLLLFILFIIPGFVFKRTYFFGEFSKQFSVKQPIYTAIFYSFIPGIVVQTLCYLIFWLLFNPEYKVQEFLVYESYASGGSLHEKLELGHFFLYQTYVNFFAVFLGWSLSKLVRWLKLDIKTKAFRYSNQWYYIFSGEILSFKKFKSFHKLLKKNAVDVKNDETKDYRYYPPKVDIIIQSNEEKGTLYSGYLIDYDLNPKDIHSLDKIYLKNAHRYRKKRDDDKEEMIKGNKTMVPIKGDYFILNASEFINMNITHIQTPDKYLQEKRNKTLSLIYNVGLIVNLLLFIDILFFNAKFSHYLWPETIYSAIQESSFVIRFFLATSTNLVIAFFMPVQDGKNKYSYNVPKAYFAKVILLLICLGVIWIFM